MTNSPDKPNEPAKPRYGPESNFKGKAGRSGPPKGNRNALRHGLAAGQLHSHLKYLEVRLNSFRRQLEDTVLAAKGDISLADAAFIQTILRWERHAALAQRWLNQSYDEMEASERLHFSREVARASAERDKAITALDLGKPLQTNLHDYIEGVVTNGD